MIYKTISSKTIISKVIRDFGITTLDWVPDSIEWIGEAIEDLHTYASVIRKYVDATVKSHRIPMPCDLAAIVAIEYKGIRLPYGGDDTFAALICTDRTTKTIPNTSENATSSSVTMSDGTVIQTQLPIRDSSISDLNESYQIIPGYIVTSFSSGTTRLHYDAFPTDKEGFPLVPDEYNYRTAIGWYLFAHLLMSGLTHPVFKYGDAEQRWNIFRQKAINAGAYPSVDKMFKFKSMFARLTMQENNWDNFFIGAETPENIDS